jgi:hypothetical protein
VQAGRQHQKGHEADLLGLRDGGPGPGEAEHFLGCALRAQVTRSVEFEVGLAQGPLCRTFPLQRPPFGSASGQGEQAVDGAGGAHDQEAGPQHHQDEEVQRQVGPPAAPRHGHQSIIRAQGGGGHDSHHEKQNGPDDGAHAGRPGQRPATAVASAASVASGRGTDT